MGIFNTPSLSQAHSNIKRTYNASKSSKHRYHLLQRPLHRLLPPRQLLLYRHRHTHRINTQRALIYSVYPHIHPVTPPPHLARLIHRVASTKNAHQHRVLNQHRIAHHVHSIYRVCPVRAVTHRHTVRSTATQQHMQQCAQKHTPQRAYHNSPICSHTRPSFQRSHSHSRLLTRPSSLRPLAYTHLRSSVQMALSLAPPRMSRRSVLSLRLPMPALNAKSTIASKRPCVLSCLMPLQKATAGARSSVSHLSAVASSQVVAFVTPLVCPHPQVRTPAGHRYAFLLKLSHLFMCERRFSLACLAIIATPSLLILLLVLLFLHMLIILRH